MSKSYRKPTNPTTKKAFVGIDKDNGKDIFIDTGLPVIASTSEFMRDVEGADEPTHDCIACSKRTSVLSSRCQECRDNDKDLSDKMRRLTKLTREGIVYEDNKMPLVPNGVRDGEWSPNKSFDERIVEEETNKLCTNCFIVLPKAFGLKRLCESCRAD